MTVDNAQGPLKYITMAAVSKVAAVATTYPYQVVRARLQVSVCVSACTFANICVYDRIKNKDMEE